MTTILQAKKKELSIMEEGTFVVNKKLSNYTYFVPHFAWFGQQAFRVNRRYPLGVLKL